MPTSAAELNRRFGISNVATVVDGKGGLPKVRIASPAVAGEMYLHGAHVTSWKPGGENEVLYLSPRSLWQDGTAIRGGVPVCFPWFGDKAGDPQAPAHGFVRTKSWHLDSIERDGDTVSVSMFTDSSKSTQKWWPPDFRLLHRATFGAELLLELIVTNTGSAPLRFEEALHAYYKVGDATKTSISGLDHTQYLDKTDSFREKTQSGDVLIRAETDRVYLDTEKPLRMVDGVLHRRIVVSKENSRTTVIWNPFPEKAAGLKDLGQDQWKSMLCIEVTNVGEYAVELAPGEQHRMAARVSVGG
jgi:glucose-6-phosphate 1-epimerase